MWLAGGGIRPGITYAETDDHSFNVARDPVHVPNDTGTHLESAKFPVPTAGQVITAGFNGDQCGQ